MPLSASRFTSARRRELELEELVAAVAVLRRFDRAMRHASYDYGGGQRRRELRSFEYELRYRRDAQERAAFLRRDGWLDARPVEQVLVDELENRRPELLLEVFDAMMTPRLRRLSWTRRGYLIEVLHGLVELELAGGRDALELDGVSLSQVEEDVEQWLAARRIS